MAKKEKKYRSAREVLEDLLNLETWDTDPSGIRHKMTVGDLIHVKMVKKAMNGDINAYREILDRMEGKAVQKVEEKTEHTFQSRPLGELIQFVKPKKQLSPEDALALRETKVIEMKEQKDGSFSLDTDSEIVEVSHGSDS